MRMTKADEARLLRLHQQGYSARVIAEMIGVSHATVARRVNFVEQCTVAIARFSSAADELYQALHTAVTYADLESVRKISRDIYDSRLTTQSIAVQQEIENIRGEARDTRKSNPRRLRAVR